MMFKLQRTTLVQILILVTGFGLLFFNTIRGLINDWSTDPNFSHGFLVPFIVLYMVWHKKEQLAVLSRRPAIGGLLLIVMGMLSHMAGTIGAELFVMRVSMVITLAGIVLYLCGSQIFTALLAPLAYLIIMIPIPAIVWNKIAFPLQLFAARLSADMINMLGIPVFREGNILRLAETSLEVVDACSGLRSLTSLLALSGVFAFIAPLGFWKKWILFFSAIPIAVVVNIMRLTATAVMATYIGPETAQGFLHEMSGILVFIVALGLVYLVFIIESRIEKHRS
ncbi:MAG: exosortase/archaeosortase family protein [Pseudomonadota bacterium]